MSDQMSLLAIPDGYVQISAEDLADLNAEVKALDGLLYKWQERAVDVIGALVMVFALLVVWSLAS